MSAIKEVEYALLSTTGDDQQQQQKKNKKKKNRSKKRSRVDAELETDEQDDDEQAFLTSMQSGGWKKVDLSEVEIEGFEDGCAFELEELTEYAVQETEAGGCILVGRDAAKDTTNAQTATSSEAQAQKKKKKNNKKQPRSNEPEASKEPAAPVKPVHLPKWSKFKLHPRLLQSLHGCGFLTPTPIQEKTIYPAMIDHRDIVGAAPTGSGKTLAFGLPILSQLLAEKESAAYTKDCKALILTPTRELALQIHQHLEKMVPNREIGIATLVGGMAVQKQKRLLSYRPEIVIGTPGRLWDLIHEKQEHLRDLHLTLQFLVIDEADRMLQTGSYPEVEKIFDALKQKRKSPASELVDASEDEDLGEGEQDEQDESMAGEAKVIMLDDVLKMHAKQKEQEEEEEDEAEDPEPEQQHQEPARRIRQTFLFSATLTIPEGGRFQKNGKPKRKEMRHALTVLESVMKRVGLRGKPAVVDLSIDESTGKKNLLPEDEEKQRKKQLENVKLSLPDGLELCQYEVTDATRDSYLYYFLTQYPGRTIVFLNAIHQVRKLCSLLQLLQLPVFALHAEMQQRQRLKKLDQFRAHPQGILVATDIAARGLDIPSVEYVVHYHIARSTEVFVHRSGRTARAAKEGLSISFVSPVDAKYHAQICKVLQRPTGLADFPFDHRYLPVIDERLRLAKAICDDDNSSGKAKSEETWFSQMAEAADLELDDDLMMQLQQKKQARGKAKDGEAIATKRIKLQQLLKEPLRPVGSMRKFRQIHQELGSQLTHEGEYKHRDANEDLVTKSKKSFKRFRRRK